MKFEKWNTRFPSSSTTFERPRPPDIEAWTLLSSVWGPLPFLCGGGAFRSGAKWPRCCEMPPWTLRTMARNSGHRMFGRSTVRIRAERGVCPPAVLPGRLARVAVPYSLSMRWQPWHSWPLERTSVPSLPFSFLSYSTYCSISNIPGVQDRGETRAPGQVFPRRGGTGI